MKKKLYLVVNVDWFFLSHRLPIALEAIKQGYEVTVFAIEDKGKGDEIRSYGCRFVPIPATRSGTNPFSELYTLFFLYRHYKKGQPHIVHHVAMKPVTYGSIAAKLAGVPLVVNALSGLGFLFINPDKNRISHLFVSRMFRFGFNNPRIRFILQNNDDYELIKGMGLISPQHIFLIKGSGVDLNEFPHTPLPEELWPDQALMVTLPARMLWDKGVGEFVEAAKKLHTKYQDKVKFVLAGGVDLENRAGIQERKLIEWSDSKVVSWIGFQSDMVKILQRSSIIVLPSYREGLPKSLIEACAIGRPIVTTDVPGCREVVVDGINGYLVPAKESEQLANKIDVLLSDKGLRERLGKKGREKAEQEFSIEDVISKTLHIYKT